MRNIITLLLFCLFLPTAYGQDFGEIILENNKPVEKTIKMEGYDKKCTPVVLSVEFNFDQLAEKLTATIKYNATANTYTSSEYDLLWFPNETVWFSELKKHMKKKYKEKFVLSKALKKQGKEQQKNKYKIVNAISVNNLLLTDLTMNSVNTLDSSVKNSLDAQMFPLVNGSFMVLECDVQDRATMASIRFCNLIPVSSKHVAFSRLKKKYTLQYIGDDAEYYFRINWDPCLEEAGGIEEIVQHTHLLNEKLEFLKKEKARIVKEFKSCHSFDSLRMNILEQCKQTDIKAKYKSFRCPALLDSLRAYATVYNEIAYLGCDTIDPCNHPDNSKILDSLTIDIQTLKELHNKLTIESNRRHYAGFKEEQKKLEKYDPTRYQGVKTRPNVPHCQKLFDMTDEYNNLFNEINTMEVPAIPPCKVTAEELSQATVALNDLINKCTKSNDKKCMDEYNNITFELDKKLKSSGGACGKISSQIKQYESAKQLFNKLLTQK